VQQALAVLVLHKDPEGLHVAMYLILSVVAFLNPTEGLHKWMCIFFGTTAHTHGWGTPWAMLK